MSQGEEDWSSDPLHQDHNLAYTSWRTPGWNGRKIIDVRQLHIWNLAPEGNKKKKCCVKNQVQEAPKLLQERKYSASEEAGGLEQQ